jgi:hypothetical protein
MKKNIILTAIASILMFSQANAFAGQWFEDKLERKQQRQTYEIKEGFRHGDFSFYELKKLIIAQHELNNLSSRFIEDGRYGHREKRILRKKLHRIDDMIDRMKSHHHSDKQKTKHSYSDQKRKSKRQQS